MTQNGLDLNARCETIKLLERNIGSKLFDITLNNICLDISPQARKTHKQTKNNWDYIKLKLFAQ